MAEPSQLTQHIESFVDSSRSSTQQAASLDAIVSFVKNDVVTISSLVREMEMYLTTTDSIIRARGILLLGEALKCLSSKPLDAATIHSMTSFFKERLKKSNEVFLRFSFLISLGFTLKPFFEFLCGIFVYAGMVIDYNSSENSIIVSLQGFNYGAHMNRKNRSNLVYALGTQAGIADWRALRGALVGCLALVKRKSGGMVTSSDAKGVAESFLQNLQVQSLGQHDRKLCFELMECLLEHYPHAVASLGDDLIYGICEAIDGEKDPQCLMLAFHIMEVLVRVFPDPCGPIESFASDLFGILSSYFPIHFTHLLQKLSLLSIKLWDNLKVELVSGNLWRTDDKAKCQWPFWDNDRFEPMLGAVEEPKAEEDVEVKRDDLSRALMDKFGAFLDDFQEMFGAVNSAVYSILVDFRLNL
ncbi:hypothetical protein POTOM_062112 [Populus tomentosa]|uniref:MMS19 nucleotide excision repair protein n=1 Tax=Populus tomentosa TaxID=118781 RepID=A0A8X7XLK0_POPTO|nr:hypothetical protein POTOM_062112 [Populus tomentosa]